MPGRFPFKIATRAASAHPAACWSPASDHRWREHAENGLSYVADAFGPTYGGYYAPYGVDPGLAALVASYDDVVGDGCARLQRAFESAHVMMKRLSDEYYQACEVRLRSGEKDRLRAAGLASDDVRPAAWAHLAGKSLAHFGASVTACGLSGGESLAIAQVGDCRAYRHRARKLELLVPDHTLSTAMAASGKVDDNPKFHSGIVAHLLGHGDLHVDSVTVTVEAGDTIVLCSKSVWTRGDGLLTDLCETPPSATSVEKFVAECAADDKHDATIVIVAFSE